MTKQEITQARADLELLDIEQLRCGVMLQLLNIEALTKERDELQSRVNQQAAMVEKSIEEMNRNADIGAQAGKERDALAAAGKLALEALKHSAYAYGNSWGGDQCRAAIASLEEAGVQ